MTTLFRPLRKRWVRNILAGVAMALSAVAAPTAYAADSAQSGANTGSAAGTATAPDVTARDIFVKLPISVLDLLSKSTRLDMLDYMDVDSIWEAPNVLQGTSHLNRVTPDYLSVTLTDVSTLEIKILPSKKGPLVMTVYTVGERPADEYSDADPDENPELAQRGGSMRELPALRGADSQVQFFTADLSPLRTDRYFKMPKLKDLLSLPKDVKLKEVENHLPFETVLLKASPDANTLTATLTLGTNVPVEDRDAVSPYIRPEVTLTWRGDKFK